jgi:hypothetical protein
MLLFLSNLLNNIFSSLIIVTIYFHIFHYLYPLNLLFFIFIIIFLLSYIILFNFIAAISVICYLIIGIQLKILIVIRNGFKNWLEFEKFMEGF